MWQSNLSWERAKQRAEIIQSIRNFFVQRDVVEVETPLLCNGTITDVYIDSFNCRFDFSESSDSQTNLYLQTSPEFAMKRLLASGYGSIFQLCKAFRHEPFGSFHNPEFTMLEWYRLDYDHDDLMQEVEEFLLMLLPIDGSDRLTYQQAFIRYLQIDPLDCQLLELKEKLSSENIQGDWIENEMDKDILLQVLFSERIEKKIGQSSPCFIYNFPKSQSALAKLSTDDPRVAERFECYFKGIELANGFNELTDANEQLKRFEEDNIKRAKLGKALKPIDMNFIDALNAGLPNCSGVALGIDRLLMLIMNADTIKETMSFDINNA